MADESKESSKPSWKRKKAATPSPTPGPPRRASAARHAWTKRREKASDEIGVPRSWLLRLLAVGSAFAACIVGLVILILMIRLPEPAAVVLVQADYATNLAIPHNIPGKKGIDALQALAKAPRSFTLFNSPSLRPVLEAPYVLDRRSQWADLIREIEAKNIHEKTVVFVLAIHGLSDKSQAYLLPNLAASPEDALPLVDVIESMKSEKLKGKNKILILEGAGIPSDWRLGMLKNEFAARLRELESKIEEVDRLWVLNASDVDQRCWTSEGLGTSVFFHYLAKAFKGNGTGVDRRLDLNELHAYLGRNVKDWVWHARAALQEPILLPASRGTAKSGQNSRALAGNHPSSKDVYLALTSGEAADALLTASKTVDRDELKGAWASFQRLDAQTPHPSVYSPTLWRLYRASLVRCEELIHSGEPAEAEYLLGRLKAFEGRLASERPLKLSKSAQNSLAMNAVQGGSIGDHSPPPQLIEFWQATRPDQLKQLWREIKNSGPSASGEQVLAGAMPRERAAAYLLGRAVSSDGASGNLEKAAERIRIINDEETPLPSEAHFLRMISNREYLPLTGRSTEFQSLVIQAIALRLQAERSALGVKEDQAADEFPYCEQIHPWISQLVDRADISRRKAEDLLFATEDQAARDAGIAIASAREQYQAITSRAQAVRSALAVRDRVFAELPEYCRWLPHRHARDIADEKFAEKVRDLWPRVHELSAMLEEPSPTSDVSDLARKSKVEVLAGLEAVKKKFIEQQHEYDSDRQPEDWEAAMAAVAVPFSGRGGLTLRGTIWDRLDTIRQKDITLAGKLEPVAVSEDDVKKKLEDVRSRAVLEAKMAISILGPAWYDERRFGDGSSSQFAADSELIEKAAKTDKEWRQTLAAVGGRVGARIRAIETRIAELVSKPDQISTVQGARERLPEAVRLARRLDSRASLPIKEDSSHPALGLRRLRGHELLNWLAERAWLDHWYGEDPKALPPYFSEIGMRFLADAQELFPKSSDSLEKQKLFATKSGLAFDDPKPILFTSERKREVAYHLVENGKVPDGIPVVKADVQPGLTVEESHAGGYRMASRRTEGGGGSQSIAFTLSSSLITEAEPDSRRLVPRVESVNFGVRGFFRGQVFERLTGVEIDPVPEISIKGPGLPEPPLASIAVQADQKVVDEFGGGNGAIAVVLDCSGSMKSGEGGTSKIDEARRSLVRVLEKLPPKTRLSIWIFGQAADGFVDEQHARDIDVRQNQNPWETIRPLREAAPWDPSDLEPLRKKFDAIIPFHPTPLMQAMWGAKLDLDKAQGLKTMLVLTDGADDQFDKNLTFNPGHVTIPAFIRENFKNAGIMINMILFKLGQSGEKEARGQFEAAITQLEPAGHVFTARDEEKLLETLRRSIKRDLTCTITGSDGKTIGELPVTSPDQVTSWWAKGFGPGAYTLKVQANQLYSKEIDLEKGERLIIRLVSTGGGIGFERGSYSNPDTFPLRKETGNAGGWRFSVARYRFEEREPVGSLQLFTVLEPANGGMPRLRQVYPGFVWFEIAPQSGAGSFTVRWQELDAYPAPVWRADIPQWLTDTSSTGPASPVVKAWWSGDKDSSKSLSLDPVEFQERIQRVKDIEVRTDDGDAVIIEGIVVEPHTLRTRSDREPSEASCLVVRLRYPVGKPCLVDPGSLGKIVPRGYEHRFYTRAGAYTGIFGPVAETEVEELRSLRVIPVARLKERAEAGKRVADLKLAQPKGDDKTPLPRPITVGH